MPKYVIEREIPGAGKLSKITRVARMIDPTTSERSRLLVANSNKEKVDARCISG